MSAPEITIVNPVRTDPVKDARDAAALLARPAKTTSPSLLIICAATSLLLGLLATTLTQGLLPVLGGLFVAGGTGLHLALRRRGGSVIAVALVCFGAGLALAGLIHIAGGLL